MIVVGVSAFYHDSAAALVKDGEIVAAAQEDRFSRKKHDAGFPRRALKSCLDAGRISLSDVDYFVFYDKPFLKFERLLETYMSYAPTGFRSFRMAMPIWLREKLFLKSFILKELESHFSVRLREDQILFTEHHLSHAASAFYPSPFQRAAVLTMDGVGEWTTTSTAVGRDSSIQILREIHFPHSLGLLYSAFTYYLGFRVNSGEYKVMGLAPYGEPKQAAAIREHLIDVKPDGSFRLNLDYFDYCAGLTMTNARFDELFGAPPRSPEAALTQFHMNVAASVQRVVEEVVLRLGRSIARDTGESRLCLAGGVALNCVANGELLRSGAFSDLWIQPASGDAGGALGAALAVSHGQGGRPRAVPSPDGMGGACLGPEFTQADIEERLAASGARFVVLEDSALLREAAADLAKELALGWFQGRAEFGPRALGARSILADPRSPRMQSILNMKVKFRESFRPFAPAVLREDAADWFDLDRASPYMLLVAPVTAGRLLPEPALDEPPVGLDKLKVPRSQIPAVTHVDSSARIQTVDERTNPRFHALIRQFQALTGTPVLVNTSFNVRGEPIVHTPEDAFRCFMGTDLERLAVGNCYLKKEDQPAELKRSYHREFDLD